jgi:glycosyltransferase involved in cell wall biosynthesis
MKELRYRCVVLNQSQSPMFQAVWEHLTDHVGPTLIYTGMPQPAHTDQVRVAAAPRYRRKNLLTRAVSWWVYWLAALSRVWRLPGRPFVVAVTNPPFLPQLAWLLHKWRGHPYGLLFWDIYPNHMVQVGLLKRGSWLTRWWTDLNRRAMLEASAIVTISAQMADVLRAQLGAQAAQCRIDVIPNWADTDELKPLPKQANPFALEHGQVDKVTVLYSGNMGRTHGLGAIVEAARLLRDDARLSFLLIGDGLGRAELEQSALRHDLTNVVFCPLQPWEQVPYSLATGDIAVITQAGDSANLSLPSKTYSMLAVGCALIACTHRPSDLAALVDVSDLGGVCPPGDGAALAQTIQQLAGDPSRLAACRARARQIAEQQFSIQAAVRQWAMVLQPVINQSV